MFGRATITLGIGPHSILFIFWFRFAFYRFYWFSACYYVVCFGCVRCSFFNTKPRDNLGRMSPK